MVPSRRQNSWNFAKKCPKQHIKTMGGSQIRVIEFGDVFSNQPKIEKDAFTPDVIQPESETAESAVVAVNETEGFWDKYWGFFAAPQQYPRGQTCFPLCWDCLLVALSHSACFGRLLPCEGQFYLRYCGRSPLFTVWLILISVVSYLFYGVKRIPGWIKSGTALFLSVMAFLLIPILDKDYSFYTQRAITFRGPGDLSLADHVTVTDYLSFELLLLRQSDSQPFSVVRPGGECCD